MAYDKIIAAAPPREFFDAARNRLDAAERYFDVLLNPPPLPKDAPNLERLLQGWRVAQPSDNPNKSND